MELFTCDRHAGDLRVTPVGCAEMWNKAQGQLDRGDRLMTCRVCEIGARHAGKEGAQVRERTYIDAICPRCHKPADRIVKGVCVSCRNRELELRRGVNAKGSYPVRARRLQDQSIMVVSPGAMLVMVPSVASRLEAELRLLKDLPTGVRFGRRVAPATSFFQAGPVQLGLWGGL